MILKCLQMIEISNHMLCICLNFKSYRQWISIHRQWRWIHQDWHRKIRWQWIQQEQWSNARAFDALHRKRRWSAGATDSLAETANSSAGAVNSGGFTEGRWIHHRGGHEGRRLHQHERWIQERWIHMIWNLNHMCKTYDLKFKSYVLHII